MTQYSERFHDHPLHSEISDLRESINSAELDFSSRDVRDGYDRFLVAVGFVERYLTSADPELVTAGALHTLEKQINALGNFHEVFKQNQNDPALNDVVDAVLDQLNLLPQINDGASDYSEVLEDLRKRSNAALDALKARQTELETERDTLAERLQTLKAAIEQQDELFEAQKGRIDKLITTQQTAFNTEQQQRNTQLNEALKTHETTAKAVVEQFKKQLQTLLDAKGEAADTQREGHDTKAQVQMDSLVEHLDHAKKIVGLIGNTGMTGHYQEVANRELRSAFWFRIFALAFFILMACVIMWIVYEIRSEEFNWEVALFRVAVAAALLAPAWYCARESTRHRKVENRNRRIELELAAINPYLESLSQENKQAVIERLADRYFGNEAPDLDASSEDNITKMPTGDLLKILEQFAKIFRH